MASKPLVECSFLIPTRGDKALSAGRPHKRSAWKWLKLEMLKAFQGGTQATVPYEGWYIDPDTSEPVTDESRKFYVALPRGDIDRLRSLLREACGVFHQKCIYLSVAGAVELVEPVHERSP